MKPYNGGEWTAARFHSFIKGALRSATMRWGPKFRALDKAFVGRKTNRKTGRIAKHFRCACCDKDFPSSEVVVDHINPVVCPIQGFVSWDVLVERMFCEVDGFQVLCKPCHKIKCAEETKIRKANK